MTNPRDTARHMQGKKVSQRICTPSKAHAFCVMTSLRSDEMTESSSVALAMSWLSGVAREVLTKIARTSQPHRRRLGQCSRRDRRSALVWVVALNPSVGTQALPPRPLVGDEVVACVVEATGSIREEQVRGVGVVAIVCRAQPR